MQRDTADPLTRYGLVFAGANEQDPPKDYGNGILTAREVLSLDLRKTDLLVLSACGTGLGGEGAQGLRRAFELAGVHTLICTLWSVDDTASAVLMERFYANLIEEGMEKLPALTEAKDYLKGLTNSQLIDYYKGNGFINEIERIEDECKRQGLSLRDWLEDYSEDMPFKSPYFWAGYVLQGGI